MTAPPLNIIQAIHSPRGFRPLFPKGLETWARWLVALKAAFALPMTNEELEVYRRFTGREKAPARPPRELWFLIGRRGGKSFMAALISVFLAVFVPWPLGLELGYVMIIATDRRQAQVVLNYVKKILALQAFREMVLSETREEIVLKNGMVIAVQSCSFRTLRGFQICAAVLDEVGFWRNEYSANPAPEILRALRPSLGMFVESKLISISTGFQASGPLFEVYRDLFGVDDEETLVWAASTSAMNPAYSKKTIQRALKEDYAAASVEYGVDGIFFRQDLAGFLPVEALDAVVAPGRLELPPMRTVRYTAGVDSSGGTGQDSMVLSIAHKEREKVVQDLVRAFHPPFDPHAATASFALTLKEYRVASVVGDAFSGDWCGSYFRECGISYNRTKTTKSDYYLEFGPLVMRRGCELLDHKKQTTEFRQLLRRTGTGGDKVDHPPRGHDDHANACAIALIEAARVEERGAAVIIGKYIHDLVGGDSQFDSDGGGPGGSFREAFAKARARAREDD